MRIAASSYSDFVLVADAIGALSPVLYSPSTTATHLVTLANYGAYRIEVTGISESSSQILTDFPSAVALANGINGSSNGGDVSSLGQYIVNSYADFKLAANHTGGSIYAVFYVASGGSATGLVAVTATVVVATSETTGAVSTSTVLADFPAAVQIQSALDLT